MRFTTQQYDNAIANLQEAKKQLEPDGRHCPICTDSDHMAWECRHNPLKAMAMCETIAKAAQELHETLHWFAGYDFNMCMQRGPANVSLPRNE